MNKKILLLMIVMLSFGVCGHAEEADNPEIPDFKIDTKKVHYSDANLPRAINKYNAGNYTGCLQEMISILQKNPASPVANYYAGLSFARVGDNQAAIYYFDKVASNSTNKAVVQYAVQARDCLSGVTECKLTDEEQIIEALIKAPYSDAMLMPADKKLDMKQRELESIKQQINDGTYLNYADDGVKIAQASDEEILQAIRTLKEAGVTVTVNTPNQYTQQMYQDPQMAEMQMLLGGGNGNNNSNNAIMNLLPMMMSNNEGNGGKNIDPQVIQAVMMQSMMPDFGNFGSNNNR